MKKFSVTLGLLLATVLLLALPSMAAEEIDPLPHIHSVTTWAQTEAGHSGLCTDCGETVTQPHTYSESNVTQPTCQAPGSKTFTCLCGHSYEEVLPQLPDHVVETWTSDEANHSGTCIHCGQIVSTPHSHSEGNVIQPTCQAPGSKTFTCLCGHSYEEVLPQLPDHVYGEYSTDDTHHHRKCTFCQQTLSEGHLWDEGKVLTAASCTTAGRMLRTCTACGYSHEETIAATGHAYGPWQSINTDYHRRQCACGHKEEKKHVWDAGVVTTDSTCDSKGIKTHTCVDCGRTKTSQVNALPHTYDHSCDISCNVCGYIRRTSHQYEDAWTTTGDQHWHECTVCGFDGDLGNHRAGDWIVDVPVGEYSDGQKHRECKDCGTLMETQAIPATGCLHGNEELRGQKAPSCSEEGYTGDLVCPRCNAVVTPGQVIAKEAHQPALENQKDTSCAEAGYTGDLVCQVCRAIVAAGEVIDPLPHETVRTGVKVPNCTEDGYTGDRVCTNCQAIVVQGEVIPALGHWFFHGVCTDCQAEDPDYVPPTQPTVPPTEPPTAPPTAPSSQPTAPSGKPTEATRPTAPTTPSTPAATESPTEPIGEPEPLPMRPIVIICAVVLGFAFIGMGVLIFLLLKKK